MPDFSFLDRTHFLHPFTDLTAHQANGMPVMARGTGSRIYDIHGNGYIDGLAGLWCVNVGYGRTEIRDAVARQIDELSYCHSFAGMTHQPAVLLAARLAGMAPGALNKIFFGQSGSDANDTAIKIVRYYWNVRGEVKRKKIISRRRAYHGVTVAASSLTGLPSSHQAFDVPESFVIHVTPPHAFQQSPVEETTSQFVSRLANELEQVIAEHGAETIGAFIAEPVQGAGGVIVPPEDYFKAIMPILKRYGILFIADEVVCGFGRLGYMFGSKMYGLTPDILTLAKGVTSGYVPLSGTMITDEIWEILRQGSDKYGSFGHGYTYSAHPVATAAALANLDIIENENLIERAATMGTYLQRQLRLRIAQHPLVGEVRGTGLVAGIELSAHRGNRSPFAPSARAAQRVARAALDRGMITRALPNGDILAISPPLVITTAEIDEIIEKMSGALNDAADQLESEGIWKAN